MYFAKRRISLLTVVLVLLSIGAPQVRSISAAVSVPGGGSRQTVVKAEFQGTVEVQFCIKNGDGRWDLFDKLTVPSVRFAATLDSITKGKEVARDLEFQGKTTGGREVSVRMIRPGKSVPNLTDGKVGLLLPLRITVNGKSADVNLELSTESITNTGATTISGRRLEVDQATGTVKFALVGSQIANGLIAMAGPSTGTTTTTEMHFPGSEVRVVMQLSGRLIAI